MLPYLHVIISLIASLILYALKINPLFILLFFLASILIDFDHYLLYVFRKKRFNPFKAYNYCRNDSEKEFLKEGKNRILFAFHNLEVFLILLILSFFISFFIPIILGYSFHSIIDIISEMPEKVKKDWSIIHYYEKYLFHTKKA
jgi:hypothetical protein